jgi:hypothetical protein
MADCAKCSVRWFDILLLQFHNTKKTKPGTFVPGFFIYMDEEITFRSVLTTSQEHLIINHFDPILKNSYQNLIKVL